MSLNQRRNIAKWFLLLEVINAITEEDKYYYENHKPPQTEILEGTFKI